MSLPAMLLVMAELRMRILAVSFESNMRIVLFVCCAFSVQRLKVIFSNCLVTQVYGQHFGVIHIWQEILVEFHLELFIGFRHLFEELMEHEPKVKCYVVADQEFL